MKLVELTVRILLMIARRRRVELCGRSVETRLQLNRKIWRHRVGSGRCRQLSGSVSYSRGGSRERFDRSCHRSRTREWPSLDLRLLHDHAAILRRGNARPSRPVRFGSRVVVCELQPDLASVFALARQPLPYIVLAASGNDNTGQVDERLADQFRLLVFAKHRELDVVVV